MARVDVAAQLKFLTLLQFDQNSLCVALENGVPLIAANTLRINFN